MHNHDKVIEKMTMLRDRVLHSPHDNTKDLIWCKRMVSDVKDSGLVPNKEEFTMANLMWRKYAN